MNWRPELHCKMGAEGSQLTTGHRFRSPFLIHLICCFFATLFFPLDSEALDWSSPQIQSNNATMLLKSFIESPPESGEMVFLYHSSFLPKPQVGATNNTEKEVEYFYRAVWRGSDYYIARLATLDFNEKTAATNLLEVGGMYQGKPWYYMLTRGVLSISEDKLEDSKDQDVRNMHGLFESRFGSARAFGVLHAPGSFKWDGDSFHAIAYDGSGAEFTGTLMLEASGQPSSLQFSAIVGKQNIGGKVKLSYGKPLSGLNLPESYDVELEIGTNKIPFADVHFYSINITNGVSADDFYPRGVIADLRKPQVSLVTSNSSVFYVTASSKLAPMQPPATAKAGTRRAFFLFGLLIMSATTGFLCWKLGKTK